MRYRLMATYRGVPYEAGIGPTDRDVVLFAACPPPEELGFEPATGHWRKQLRLDEVQAVWESRPVGAFRGERCMVLDDLGDRLHIGYLGHDGFKAEQLGYWQVDRGVFELIAPRSEVTDIREERTEYPRVHAAPGPVTGPLPAVSVPGSYSPGSTGQHTIPAAYMSVADPGTGVALPVAAPAPLPLEAEALRAAAQRSRPAEGNGAVGSRGAVPPVNPVVLGAKPATEPQAGAPGTLMEAKPARPSRTRLATELVFADLAALAGIPAGSYAIGDPVEGAMCLVPTEQGFEVFNFVQGGRQELQKFDNEEAACFYLFGVLAAEAVRSA